MLVKQKLFYSNRQENLQMKVNGKRRYPTNLVKYLGINIDENLNWNGNNRFLIAIKLNKVNGILSKLRHFIDRKTLKSIYHAIYAILNPIYITPHLFGHKLQIQLKDYLFCKSCPYGLYIS